MSIRKRIKRIFGKCRIIRAIYSRSSYAEDRGKYVMDIPQGNDYGRFQLVKDGVEPFHHYVGFYSISSAESFFEISERIISVAERMTGHFDNASVTIIAFGQESPESAVLCAQFRSLIYGWSCELSSEGIVCNGVFSHSQEIPPEVLSDTISYLSSGWGQVLNGEVVEISKNSD